MVNSSKSLFKIIFQALFVAFFSIALIHCGSSSTDNTPSTSTLNGTAAIGVPIDGTILVTDSLGATATAVIDASGNYTVDVTGMTPPFVIAAIPNDSSMDTQYSFASQANITVNVTPMTTLALYNASGQQDLNMLQSDWVNQFSGITQQQLDNAAATIGANFTSLFSGQGLDPATFDIFSSPFNADGAGFDAILDGLDITLDPTNNAFAVNVGGIPFGFDLNIDISGGSGQSSGSVMLGGTGAGGLPSPFTPQTYTELAIGVNSLSWTLTDGNTVYTLNVLEGVSVGFTVTVLNGNQSSTTGWAMTGNAGVNINSTNVIFNVSLMGGLGEALTTLTIAGELSRNLGRPE